LVHERLGLVLLLLLLLQQQLLRLRGGSQLPVSCGCGGKVDSWVSSCLGKIGHRLGFHTLEKIGFLWFDNPFYIISLDRLKEFIANFSNSTHFTAKFVYYFLH
jgi:hypothetical protein